MKDEESQRIAVVDAFTVADNKIKELTTKLTESEWDKKSAESALEWVKRQAESQCKQLFQTNDQLFTAKKLITSLKKKLEEVEKAKDQAEQDGYNVGGNWDRGSTKGWGCRDM